MSNSKCGYTGATQTTGVSKHYITEYKIGYMQIAMISAHLIAFPTDITRCAEREAQASVLNPIIQNYIQKNYEIIVLGDFNDFDEMVVDANNNIPTSQVLDILKGKSIETQKYNYQLYSIANLIQKNMRYTDWYDENKDCKSSSTEFSMIDHILVSKNLYNKITNAFIYHGYDEYCGKYNSDHFPVVIDIDIV
jgi:exonuclease III